MHPGGNWAADSVTVRWKGYTLFIPRSSATAAQQQRKVARAEYELVMRSMPNRIESLRHLLRNNDVELDAGDDGIQRLNDWYRLELEAEPDAPGQIKAEWQSVSGDIGLFLGNVIIGRCQDVHWEFYTKGKRDLAYQRHVLVGFPRVPVRDYYVDICLAVSTYGHRIIESAGSIAQYGNVTIRGQELDIDDIVRRLPRRPVEADAFVSWVKRAEANA